MNRGMFVQCCGCGFTGFLELNGDFNAREKGLNRMIEEGWRYAAGWREFICPACVKAGGSTDRLYTMAVGKPRIMDRLWTYVELRDRAELQIADFSRLDGIAEEAGE